MPRITHLLLLALGVTACAPWNQPEDYYDNWSPPTVLALSETTEAGNLGGGTIEITGSGFGDDPNQIVVQFGDDNAEILSITDSKIEVKVPAGPITGGDVEVRVSTATGFASAPTPYNYDLGTQYQDEVGYVQVNNFWESCLGGLSSRLDDTYGSIGCTSVAYIGYSGIDGQALALNFAYPRLHAENIGFFGGTDQGTETWHVERPGQAGFVFGVDDLHQDIGEVVLENEDVWGGDYYCPDLDGLAAYTYGGGDVSADGEALGSTTVYVDDVVSGTGCDEGDEGAYDLSEMHFCTSLPEDGTPDYVYKPDWPVVKNFFAGKKSDYTKSAEITFNAEEVGITGVDLPIPESLVLYNDEGFEPVIDGSTGADDLWSVSALQGCFDDGDGVEDPDDVALKFSWVPSEVDYSEDGTFDAEGNCVEGVCGANTYVRLTLTVLTVNWFGGANYPIRATVVVPDENEIDSRGRSTLEVPASVLNQIPTIQFPQSGGGIGGAETSLLDPAVSDYGYVIVTAERVTDYTLASNAGGNVVFSYTTGDFGFYEWSNPQEADDCHDCLDGDRDGWIDAEDPDCAAGGTEESGFGTTACNDNVDNDGDGVTDEDDPMCENGAGEDESNCSNNEDDDDDGLEDEDDPDCVAGGNETAEVAAECADAVDNDEDGWLDAADPDCLGGDAEAGFGTTACNDGVDNDGDGFEDALDADCLDASDDDETTVVVTTGCTDGADGDGDGWTDLEDPDCLSGTDELGVGTTACNDGLDNDGDGLSDRDDADCLAAADDDESTPIVATGCTDGTDGDGDGWIDAADPDCASGSEELGLGTSACNDGADNDGDGVMDKDDTDCADASDEDEGA